MSGIENRPQTPREIRERIVKIDERIKSLTGENGLVSRLKDGAGFYTHTPLIHRGKEVPQSGLYRTNVEICEGTNENKTTRLPLLISPEFANSVVEKRKRVLRKIKAHVKTLSARKVREEAVLMRLLVNEAKEVIEENRILIKLESGVSEQLISKDDFQILLDSVLQARRNRITDEDLEIGRRLLEEKRGEKPKEKITTSNKNTCESRTEVSEFVQRVRATGVPLDRGRTEYSIVLPDGEIAKTLSEKEAIYLHTMIMLNKNKGPVTSAQIGEAAWFGLNHKFTKKEYHVLKVHHYNAKMILQEHGYSYKNHAEKSRGIPGLYTIERVSPKGFKSNE